MVATFLRRFLRGLLSFLPSNAALFIYTKILKPRPLRMLANTILKSLLPVSISIPEGVLLLNPKDPVVSGALALGAYEQYFAKMFRKSLRTGMTVIDAGANIGYYTLIASAHVGKEGRVVSYEPEHENWQFLKNTIEKNGLKNVTVLGKGLGDTFASATLYCDPNNKGKHTLLPVKGNTPTLVDIVTLDDSLLELAITKVDLIKMDVEGWEAKAFRGMQKTLETSHPILFFEFAPERIRETDEDPLYCLTKLISLGYTLENLDERSGKPMFIYDPKEFISTLYGYDGFTNIRAICAN